MTNSKMLHALLAVGAAISFAATCSAANVMKADGTADLNTAAAWVGGVPPTAGDVAVWDSAVLAAYTNNLGATTNWGGIQVLAPGGAITITNANTTLIIGAAGVDTSSGSQPLILNCPVALATNNANNLWNLGANVTLGGGLTGTNILEKTGSGTLNLSTSAGAAAILIDSGTVSLNSSSTTITNYLNGGTVNVNAAVSNPINVTAGGGTEQNVGGNRTWSGSLWGSGPLTVVASATHTWNGNNTNYTGTITLQGSGSLRISSVNSVSAGTAYNFSGGSMSANATGIFNLGSVAGSGNISGGSGQNYSIGALNASTDFGGVISGATMLIKTGTGLQNLSGANTYTGSTVVSNGVLQIGDGGGTGSLASPVVFVTNSTSVLSFNRGDASLNFTNVIAGIGAVSQDSPGTVFVSGPSGGPGANNYSGGTVLNSGTLKFTAGSLGAGGIRFTNSNPTLQWAGGNTADISSQTVTIGSGGGTLDVNGNSVTLVNPIGNNGAGSLTVKSSQAGGVLILQGANTYAGGVTVSSGTLRANNASGSATGAGNVSVSGGATLGGTGAVAGTVDVQGSLAPGNTGVGTLTVGALTLESAATNNFEFNATPANDRVVVSNAGGLTVNGGVFNLYAEGGTTAWSTPGTYNLIQFSGTAPSLDSTWTTTSASNPHIANPQIGYQYAFSAGGGFLKVTITLVSSAVVGVWNVDADGSWSDATAWSSNPNLPHAAGDSATLGVGSALRTVTLNANETIGALVMSNANSFVIASSGRTLTLDSGGGGASVTVSGGTANAIQTAVALNDNLSVSLAAGKLLTVTGVMGNTGAAKSLTVGGGGTLALSGNNTYGPAAAAGFGTTVNGGTLQVGNNSALGAGDVSVANSGTLQAGAAGLTIPNNIDLASTATATVDDNGNNLTLSGVISDSGSLTKAGNGVLTLAGTSTYTGNTTINAGVLAVSADVNVGSTPNIYLNGGDLLGTASFSLGGGHLIGVGPAAGGTGTNALIDAASGQVFEVDGVIGSAGNSGVNNLVVNSGMGNNGTVALNAANIFNGTTVVSNGTLQVMNGLALQDSTLLYSSGTVIFNGTSAATFGGLAGTNSLTLTNQSGGLVSLTVGNNNANTVYGGNLNDGALGGSLVKVGTGTFSLTGTNTYNGTTSAKVGTLEVNGGSLVTSNNLVIGQSASSTVRLTNNGVITVPGTTIGTGGSGSSPGALVVDSGTAYFGNATIGGTVNGGSITINGGTVAFGTINDKRDASSSGASLTVGIIINGGVTTVTNLLLSTGNSGADLTVSNGSLTIGDSLSVSNFVVGTGTSSSRGGFVTVRGGTLTYAGTDGMLLNVAVNSQGTAQFDGGVTTLAGITMNNAADLSGGHANLGMNGGTLYLGSVGLVANYQAAGATATVTLTSGTLGATADWSSSAPMTLSGNFTVQAADASAAAHNITLSGVLSGNGGLTKTGGGTLTLSGGNTYTNNTVVNAGTLTLQQPSLYTNSTVLVTNGATLNLGYAGVNVVAGLVLNGVSKPAGTYNHGTDPSFLAGTGSIQVVPLAKPVSHITGISLSGATLNLTATNGTAGGQYVLLQSTNLALPLAQWTPVLTNAFDGSGNLNLSTNIVNPGNAQEFYLLVQ